MQMQKSPPEELSTRAREALRDCPFYALRHLQVDQVGERLMISGTVSTFYHKQQAQEIVRSVAPGMLVVNEVVVG